jgi:regulator of chromosome condensation
MAATKTATDEQPARRRSSRASIVPPPRSAPKNPVVPNKKKLAAASDSDLSEQESDSDSDEQEQTGRKRKARSSTAARGTTTTTKNNKKVVVAAGAEGKPKAVTKKAKGTREIKPKPRRAPITGLNPLPTLFSLFPPHSLLTLASSSDEPEPLPTPTEAPRTIFIFGTGDMGQNGLGVDDPKALDEIKRPRKHIGFADKVMRRELGWEGGVADLVCGGMHTLAIDGQGKVWSWG